MDLQPVLKKVTINDLWPKTFPNVHHLIPFFFKLENVIIMVPLEKVHKAHFSYKFIIFNNILIINALLTFDFLMRHFHRLYLLYELAILPLRKSWVKADMDVSTCEICMLIHMSSKINKKEITFWWFHSNCRIVQHNAFASLKGTFLH